MATRGGAGARLTAVFSGAVVATVAATVTWCLPGAESQASDIDAAPIHYAKAKADNPVSRLQDKLDAARVAGKGDDLGELPWEESFGRLRGLLKALDIPVSSQVLVFSKTSFQLSRISPRTPRAIYFNDDVYVGYCHEGDVLEISAADPLLGTAFYSLSQHDDRLARFQRQTDSCLICHGSSRNQGMPGHVVRSVYADLEGQPVQSVGGGNIDHRTPFKDRWGGWYVTGTHGRQTHLGNLVLDDRRQKPEDLDISTGQNVVTLKGRIRTDRYLSPHSDLVALMVMEHQAAAHNLIARVTLATRMAHHDEEALNRELKEPAGKRWPSTDKRIKGPAEDLVRFLLFCGEAELTDEVKGTSDFAKEFAARGPSDPTGRSLRQFDLRRRMMKHPCSWLVYSEAFARIPDEAREFVLRRMWEVLTGRERDEVFAHLSDADRQAIHEILRATKRDLPAYWREGDTKPIPAPATATPKSDGGTPKAEPGPARK